MIRRQFYGKSDSLMIFKKCKPVKPNISQAYILFTENDQSLIGLSL